MLGIDARQFARLCQMGLAGAENSDNVQLLVRFGKISPEAAEQWATERNLPLFAGRPEASIFDPLGQLAWTPLKPSPGLHIGTLKEFVTFRRRFAITGAFGAIQAPLSCLKGRSSRDAIWA